MKIAEFFQNKAGQFSVDELGKILAIAAAILLGAAFFFTSWIPAEARAYFIPVEAALLGYAFGQGAISNIVHE